MIKADLINKISKEMDISRQEAETGVNLFFNTIKEALLRGEEIELRGFGSFRFRQRNSRSGRNPRTGEPVKVPPKKVLYFKPSKLLKEMINKTNCIPCSSAFYKREVIEKVGWLDRLGHDRDHWIRVGMVFPIYRIEEVLSSFRIHEESSTTGSSKKMRKMWLREGCITTRRYGGSIFSPFCTRYYKFLVIEGLRPILGFAYPWIRKVLRK